MLALIAILIPLVYSNICEQSKVNCFFTEYNDELWVTSVMESCYVKNIKNTNNSEMNSFPCYYISNNSTNGTFVADKCNLAYDCFTNLEKVEIKNNYSLFLMVTFALIFFIMF